MRSWFKRREKDAIKYFQSMGWISPTKRLTKCKLCGQEMNVGMYSHLEIKHNIKIKYGQPLGVYFG